MIKRYCIDETGLIQMINRHFLNREVTPGQVAEAVEAFKVDDADAPKLHSVFGIMRDNSICFDDVDFDDRNVYCEGFVNEAMIRFKRGADGIPLVRIPAPSPRLYRHRRNNDSYCGYFLMGSFFNVCSFGESGVVLRDFNFSDRSISAKQTRLQEVYGPIKPDELVSIYFIQKYIQV
jgi:hypothetical protein